VRAGCSLAVELHHALCLGSQDAAHVPLKGWGAMLLFPVSPLYASDPALHASGDVINENSVL